MSPLRAAATAGLVLLPCLLGAQDKPGSALVAAAPLKDWALQLRTDAGDPSMTLRGTEVRPISSSRIDIQELNMTVFSGDPAARVDTSVLSPAATYFPRERRVTGPGVVRLLDFRDGIEATGEQWVYTYSERQKKISMERNVRIVIHHPLPDILR